MSAHTSIFAPGKVAVITGAASGIGRAAAERLSAQGMKVVLFDRDEAALAAVAQQVGGGARWMAGDVSRYEDLESLKDLAYDAFGEISLLMNNAAIGGQGSDNWTGLDAWRRILEINLWGVIHGVHAFTPALLEQDAPAAIVNTGSKQGITNPPGVPAYGVSKAAVKTLTEQLAHGLREAGGAVTAHLLIPGWTHTAMTGSGEKPAGAWSAAQVVGAMVEGVTAGDFYILCPDNQVTPALDKARVRWSVEDLIENRPALSRWDPAWKDRFEAFIAHETQG
ncbi:MAG: short-chain dehydrogenase [Caulobacterales bacterium 68-7]|nr:MAG: short-chain dehydrogenase [Caulobacterales bacterium 68-7]